MKIIGHAALAVCLLVGATGANARPRENVSLTIPTASVDFANPVGVAAFREAVARQIALVCNLGDRLDADLSPDWQCRRELNASAEPAIRQMAARASGQQAAIN